MSSGRKATAVGIGVVLLLLVAGTASAAELDPTEPGPDPDPDPKPRPPGPFTPPQRPVDPDPAGPSFPLAPNEPGDLPEQPPLVDIVRTFPEGGTFYQVRKGDTFGGQSIDTSIAYRYLRREGFLAALQFGGLSEADAHAFGVKVANSASRRLQAIDGIQCAWFNDALYGTWGYGTNADPGPHGRAIRLVPQHADNLQRLEDGLGAARNIRLGSPSSKGDGSGTAVNAELREGFELLWMPRLNREALWDSGGTNLTTEGEEWPDGSSAGNLPPPWVMARGIEDFSNSGNDEWGC